MKVSLRRANALQNAINDTLRTIRVQDSVSVSEFEDAEAVLQTARAEANQAVTRNGALLQALYQIRKAVAVANTATDISAKLADVAYCTKEIEYFAGLSSKEVRVAPEVLAGKLDKIRNSKDEHRSLYGRDEVSTGVFTAEDIKNFQKIVADAKRVKQKLQDQILELNVRTEIELTEETVKTLQQEELL